MICGTIQAQIKAGAIQKQRLSGEKYSLMVQLQKRLNVCLFENFYINLINIISG